MNLGLLFPERLVGSLAPVRAELEHLIAAIQASWDTQHNPEGGGVALTASTSVSTPILTRADLVMSDDGLQVENTIQVEKGLRFTSGPWLFDRGISTATEQTGQAAISVQISANQDDFAPAGIDTAIMLDINATADVTITGIQRTAGQNRLLIVRNVGNGVITLAGNSASSLSQNRFLWRNWNVANLLTLEQNTSILLGVEPVNDRWELITETDLRFAQYGVSTVGTINNLDIEQSSALEMSNATAATITGIVAARRGGKLLVVVAQGAGTVTLANQSGTSTAANRIITGTGADLVLPAGTGRALLMYDSDDYLDTLVNRWRVIAVTPVTLTTDVTGVLPVANGGTAVSSYTAGSVIFAGASGTSLTQDNSDFFWDDGSDRLGIGNVVPVARLHVADGAGVIGIIAEENSTGTFAPYIVCRKSRGSFGTPTAAASGDNLGWVRFDGHDGTSYLDESASIRCVAGATQTTTNHTGYLAFYTTPSASVTPTERLRILANGYLSLIGGGLTFPATQVASADVNTLDDYEEVEWTPVLTFATPGNLSVAYSTQVGRATKIGNRIIASFNIVTTTFTHTTASGVLQVTGLPEVSITLTGNTNVGSMHFQGLTSAVFTQATPRVASGVSLIDFMGSGFGQTTSQLATTNTTSGTQVTLRGTVVYQVAT